MANIEPTTVNLKNNREITLQSPQPAEAELLLSHLKKLMHHSYRNMNHPKSYWDNFSVEEEAKILTDVKESNQKFMISAFDENRIVGNLGIFGFGGEFLKHNARLVMGISPDYHNLGLGTALMSYALKSARTLGFKRIELTVRTFNTPAISLYEKAGFRRIGILKETAFIDGEFLDEYMYEILLG